MKAIGAILGFLVVGAAFFLILPRFRSESKAKTAAAAADSSNRTGLGPQRVDLPSTEEQRERDEITRKRLPFFQSLRANFSKEISSFGVTQSVDTLDIVVTDPAPESIQTLVARAVSPTAEQYGFKKVRTFIANPPGSVEPLKLVAESTYDGAGRWNTFLK